LITHFEAPSITIYFFNNLPHFVYLKLPGDEKIK
jgi:hypothetical protein